MASSDVPGDPGDHPVPFSLRQRLTLKGRVHGIGGLTHVLLGSLVVDRLALNVENTVRRVRSNLMTCSLADQGPDRFSEGILLVAGQSVNLDKTSLVHDHVSRNLCHEGQAGVGGGLGEVPVDESETAAACRSEGNLAVSADGTTVTTNHDRPLASAMGGL
ncbi:hypothetical protein GCM10023224_45340 [Streptomonospora halophila]|uniref:Uncharacterized protein n=1 Tax=Streptomonospora halophila TaxID=427369 RepID=A0ABP9GVR9_9ACTN